MGNEAKKDSLFLRLMKNIAELARLDISDLMKWFDGLENRLSDRQKLISKDIIKEIKIRLDFCCTSD